jgi:RNA polymerase sigma-70 factor (ECF subfamily)
MAGAHEGVAWDELLAHGRFVRSLARALVDDASLADDVVQGTWLAAAAHPPSDRERVAGWLRRVATNVALKLRRGESRRTQFERVAAPREALPPTDEAVERLEAQRDVIDAVRSLDEKYRTVIVLRFFEEQSAREIARRLEMPVASVRTRLQRAVELLRETLTARNGGDAQRWLAAVAPLAWPHAAEGAGAVAWTGGAIAVAAALLMISPIGTWWRHDPAAPAAAGAIATPQDASRNAATVASSPRPGDAARNDIVAKPSSEDAVIDGRVVSAIGEPIGGVEVAWQVADERYDHRDEWSTSPTTTTDSNGCFAFHRLDLAWGLVHARKPGFVGTWERCGLTFDERRRRGLTLVLHEARSIHGTVVDENGRPVADAWVVGFNRSRIEFDWPSARSNSDGAFALDGLPLSEVEVNAFAPGFRPDHSDPIPLGVDAIAMRLRGEPRTRLELTVVDPEGRPVRDAVSKFSYSGPPPSTSFRYGVPPGFERSAIPDGGKLVREDLPAGKYMFRASASHYAFDVSGIEVDLRPGETTSARIVASAGGATARIHGRLLRGDGTPIRSEPIAVARRYNDAPCLATTDAEGSFDVESPASVGSHMLFWLPGPSLALAQPDGIGGIASTAVEPAQAVELVAVPAARLTGRVVDEDGGPVAGASLELHGQSRNPHGRVGTTSSGLDGRFVFDALAPQPAPVELVAECGPMHATASEKLTITAGETIEGVTLILPRAASVEGRVVDASGRPKAGVVIGEFRESERPFALTDSNGRFRLTGFPAGDHDLWVTKGNELFPARYALPIPIRLDAGERRTGLEVRLPAAGPAPDSISGRVVRSDGRLATDCDLSVVLTGRGGSANCLGGRNPFEFRELKPATYDLRARVFADEHLTSTEPRWFLLSKELDVKPGTADVTIVLPELPDTGAIHVAFSAGEDERTPSKVTWMVDALTEIDPEGKSGFGQEALLDDGEFELRGFPPGEFRVSLEFESGQSIERTVSFRGNETVDLGTIDLAGSARCRGVVVDPTGAAIEGVLVSPQRTLRLSLGTCEESVPDAKNTETSVTGSDGSFDVALAHGSLLVFKPGYAPLTWIKPRPEASSDAPLRFTLLPAGHLRFADVPPDLKSRGVALHLRWLAADAGRAGYEVTEAMLSTTPFRDDYEIFNLPVGDYEVWIWTTNGTGITLNSDTKPPTVDQPGVAHRWQVRIDAGATTRIDVAKDW